MKLYLCIDDTDDLESKGTGEIAEEIAFLIQEKALGQTSAVTRHQLYVHDDIPYTSHNSSMCFEIDGVGENGLEAIVDVAVDHLKKEASKISDPGLCICDVENVDVEALIDYGHRAKTEVLSKTYAYEFSKNHEIFLKEYGGTGDGVIGALAGVGLRLSGNDGRFKGKFKIPVGTYSVNELLENTAIKRIYDTSENCYLDQGAVALSGKIKTVLLDHVRVLPVYKKNGVYENCTKEQLRQY